MLSLATYLSDPCGTASLPYWKQKTIMIPDNMKIIHERDMDSQAYDDYHDEPYFRLRHDLHSIRSAATHGLELVQASHAVDAFVRLINASYTDIQVTAEHMERCRQTPVYHPELWLLLKEKGSDTALAGGIADFDREAGELILEWIQVLPRCRGRGYGQIVVNSLLARMQGIAQFATVSGKVNSPSNPERLYRKCGFTGHDVWHVLTKR